MTHSSAHVIRVLVVDDQDAVREGIDILIESSAGLETLALARTGLEAIRLCMDEQPDVVLMDLVMPEMDGLETIRQLRCIHPGLKIILLSGYLNEPLVEAALQAGATRVLSKRISPAELADAIRVTGSARAKAPGYTN